jgi:integration host factor subunit alpha
MKMTKQGLADIIYEEAFLQSKEACLSVVKSTFEIIKSELESGNKVSISGFGKWTVRKKRPRKGRNPKTGEEIMIPGHRVVTFKCSPILKKAMQS